MKAGAAAALTMAVLVSWASAAQAGGDRVTMKDGRVYAGDILFHEGGAYYLSTRDGVVRLELSDIRRIDFGPEAKA